MNELLKLTKLKKPVTTCRVCHAKDTNTDAYGRCHSCYKAKLAADMGISYGKLAARPDLPKLDQWVPFEKACVQKKDQKVVTKVCPVCGEAFETTYSTKLYCSEGCCSIAVKRMWRARYSVNNPTVKECRWCGKPLEGERKIIGYCSDRCKMAYWQSDRQKRLVTKVCESCGCEYQTIRNQQRFCSKSCAAKASGKLNAVRK